MSMFWTEPSTHAVLGSIHSDLSRALRPYHRKDLCGGEIKTWQLEWDKKQPQTKIDPKTKEKVFTRIRPIDYQRMTLMQNANLISEDGGNIVMLGGYPADDPGRLTPTSLFVEMPLMNKKQKEAAMKGWKWKNEKWAFHGLVAQVWSGRPGDGEFERSSEATKKKVIDTFEQYCFKERAGGEKTFSNWKFRMLPGVITKFRTGHRPIRSNDELEDGKTREDQRKSIEEDLIRNKVRVNYHVLSALNIWPGKELALIGMMRKDRRGDCATELDEECWDEDDVAKLKKRYKSGFVSLPSLKPSADGGVEQAEQPGNRRQKKTRKGKEKEVISSESEAETGSESEDEEVIIERNRIGRSAAPTPAEHLDQRQKKEEPEEEKFSMSLTNIDEAEEVEDEVQAGVVSETGADLTYSDADEDYIN